MLADRVRRVAPPPEACVAEQLRRRLALMAPAPGAFATDLISGDAEERGDAALTVAREWVGL